MIKKLKMIKSFDCSDTLQAKMQHHSYHNDAPFQTNFGQWYEHCEPVKPDDDIIYKGE